MSDPNERELAQSMGDPQSTIQITEPHSLSNERETRTWQNDYMEISFKGYTLRFNSWIGDNLTSYDMEYKPWVTAFERENIGYLAHYDLKPGDVVVDAGGYEGTFTVYAGKAVGEKGRVIVFEPDPENCRKLQENILLNGLQNVTVIKKALWREDKKLKFNDKHTAGSSFFGGSGPNIHDVEAVALDNELERIGVKQVNFIKMDVEGAEVQALAGAERILKSNNVHLAVASYHIINGEETSEAVESILRGFGYSVITEFPEHKTTYGLKEG